MRIHTIIWLIGIVALLFLIINTMAKNSTAETCISNNPNDIDADGIPNQIEINGYDVDNDGIVDLQLNGANQSHKDIFLTIDYLENRKPQENALRNVSAAFDNSPLCNPDGISGIKLHYDVDEALPRTPENAILNKNEVIAIKNNHLLTATETENPNREAINMEKKKLYYYAVIGDQHPNGWSGQTDGIPGCLPSLSPEGKTFFVTLGGVGWTEDPSTGERVGNVAQQAGTIMHELGHSLGLTHDNQCSIQNYKPNYLSVLNYAFQVPSLIPDRPLDYSRCKMDTLKESSLNENKGIAPSCDPWKETIIEAAAIIDPLACENDPRAVPLNQSIDYNLRNNIESSPVSSDLNCDIDRTDLVADKIDWDNIKFLQIDESEGGVIAGNNSEVEKHELTGEDILKHRLVLAKTIQNSLSDYKQGAASEGGELTPQAVRALNEVNKTIGGEINSTRLIDLANQIETVPPIVNSTLEGGEINFEGIMSFSNISNIIENEVMETGQPPNQSLDIALVSNQFDKSIKILENMKIKLAQEGGIALTEGNGLEIKSNIDRLQKVLESSKWDGN
jgi:hypothetical protein